MKRLIARLFGLLTPDDVRKYQADIAAADLKLNHQHRRISEMETELQSRYQMDQRRTLPWKPFHEVPLPHQLHTYLAGQRENAQLRAVMLQLEANITQAVEDVTGALGENLTQSAAALDALLVLHATLCRMVEWKLEETE